jgi:hypothetical protein
VKFRASGSDRNCSTVKRILRDARARQSADAAEKAAAQLEQRLTLYGAGRLEVCPIFNPIGFLSPTSESN